MPDPHAPAAFFPAEPKPPFMPRSSLYIFLTVFLTGYGLINVYIFMRGSPPPPGCGLLGERSSCCSLWLSVLSYPLGRFLSRLIPLPGEDALVLIGSFYLAVMIYLFLILLFLDTLRLIRTLLPQVLKRRFQPSGIAPRTKFLMVIGHRRDHSIPGALECLAPSYSKPGYQSPSIRRSPETTERRHGLGPAPGPDYS